ncbi:MAG: NADH-quinone oxidoreductase subunit N [Bacteroidia bacterium]|nr:NADH-quinone oxidoreductase subunit N [Bacteroidia bacterium]MDW8300825.1 NADH-quinone oxidoreductase subunit N [Bacteroidia bacterium]
MLPIILLSVFGIINLFLGFLKNRNILLIAAFTFTFITLVVNFLDWNKPIIEFDKAINNNMMSTDNISILFSGILLLTTLLLLPLSQKYLSEKEAQPAEYYAILLFSLVGAVMMVSYENMLMLFVGVEILSISMYVLTGSDKRNLKSNEAALKYFLMGAFATGWLLFGIAFIYGSTGGFSLTEIRNFVGAGGITDNLFKLGIAMLLIGILFKVSAAPFHFWTPDVYEGAPSFFTAFMSTIVKTAGFAALYKVILAITATSAVYSFWYYAFWLITVLTLLIGNVTAAYQDNFKRMMAYSSISHAGYLLLAVLSLVARSQESILFYSLSYSLATVSAFGVLILVTYPKKSESFDSFNGLAQKNPFLAFVMTVAMLSLAGIPLTAGFIGKLQIFSVAFERGMYSMLVFAVLMSSVGIYYYFKVIIAMYLKESNNEKIEVSTPFIFTLLITTLLTIILGLSPDIFLGLLR